MKKYWVFLLLTLFPILGFATDIITSTSSSMSFNPPPGDYSVIFLGNIFGVVDGVLHGTGSQIMGTMLGVFNSGVLALGGIVIMYIILVSTLNTAHEGEMLGHKWSSIWVPVRTIIGLSMLIPKASGYCAMQIFVMWVVVQGIGLADKVWDAALDYLNRGGVIIRANMNPTTSMTAGANVIAGGASVILYGQVCMLGLQTQLANARQSYLDQANSNVGPCAGTPSTKMQRFCDTAVPDFINSVDPLNIQLQSDSQGHSTSNYKALMPQFDSGSIYASLNGICGTIQWSPVNTNALMTKDNNGNPTTTPAISTLTSGDIETVQMTRGMAVGQMYTTLASVARLMVGNDPQITLNNGGTSTSNAASLVATEQFGVPLTSGYGACTSGKNGACPNWGADPTTSTTAGVLLQGTEFQGAIADYNAIMAPTLKLMSDAMNADAANKAREFIHTSEQSGWILAGSYFFDLAQLNGSAVGSSQTDDGSGLDKSSFDARQITAAFSNNGCIGAYADLCVFLNNKEAWMLIAHFN
jgi:defect-in-organelle-trafficking protein DotA